MLQIFVDADACPVKDEVIRVAERHGLRVHLVSDGGIRPHASPMIQVVVVAQGPDAADDWIAEHIEPGDIAVTNDIPLADRCLKKGAGAIQPNGRAFSQDSIGMAVATRDLMAGLREIGQITGGPAPFSKKDRSRFLQALETAVQARRRA
ncbi:MAG: YaiI/YqxD family protein [Proteobacteria bacterium]|nr:YaiI/YqxD family protein [Pseudomonadota bacterium]